MSTADSADANEPLDIDQQLANAVGPDAQRYALRCELEQQRRLLLQQWRRLDAEGEPIEQSHFPRSAIMRFLCGRKTTTVVSQVIAWQLGRRYPGLVFWKK